MKLWSYPRINSRTLVPIRGFEAQKSEPLLRTCVYSRYASLKTPILQTVLPVTGHLWTGRGLQGTPSKQWFFAEGSALQQYRLPSK